MIICLLFVEINGERVNRTNIIVTENNVRIFIILNHFNIRFLKTCNWLDKT